MIDDDGGGGGGGIGRRIGGSELVRWRNESKKVR